jgi:ABC-type dipeptide/oligopeptide/nickel transport system permease subunit
VRGAPIAHLEERLRDFIELSWVRHPPADAVVGNMLTNAASYFVRAWWLVVPPGAMIFLTVLCLYLIGDGLRDALDPRLKTH